MPNNIQMPDPTHRREWIDTMRSQMMAATPRFRKGDVVEAMVKAKDGDEYVVISCHAIVLGSVWRCDTPSTHTETGEPWLVWGMEYEVQPLYFTVNEEGEEEESPEMIASESEMTMVEPAPVRLNLVQ